MSCSNRNVKLRHTSQDVTHTHQNIALFASVIVPVFCVCMIYVMGSSAGIRYAVTMQFDVDANTEYIVLIYIVITQFLYQSSGIRFNFKK